jgi:hypothetical protein
MTKRPEPISTGIGPFGPTKLTVRTLAIEVVRVHTI